MQAERLEAETTALEGQDGQDGQEGQEGQKGQEERPSALRKLLQATVLKKTWTRLDVLTSVCLYFHVLPWGLFCGALSTTLLDLEQVNQCSTVQIGLMFTMLTLGALVGAPGGGLLLAKVDCRLFLAGVCCIYGCTTMVLPLAGSFATLMGVAFIHGILQGALDSGQNVTALLIWGWDGSAFLQAFHGMFAVGTFIGPWLTKPFLAPNWYKRVSANMTMNGTTAPINTTTADTDTYTNTDTGVDTDAETDILVVGESRVYIVYLIIGLLFITAGLLYLGVFFATRADRRWEATHNGRRPTGDAGSKQTEQSTVDRYRNPNQSRLWYMVPMAALAFIRFGAYVGLELTFSGFLMTFCVKVLGWQKPQAMAATTVYWGAFAGSRLVAILLVLCVSPTSMVLADVTLMLLGYVAMATFVTWHSAVITVCSVVAGVGQASFYGCSMSWAYRYIKVSTRVGSIFTTGAWAGMAAIPPLAAYLIDYGGPVAFVYMCLGIVLVLAASTFGATWLGLKYGSQLPRSAVEEESVVAEKATLAEFTQLSKENQKA